MLWQVILNPHAGGGKGAHDQKKIEALLKPRVCSKFAFRVRELQKPPYPDYHRQGSPGGQSFQCQRWAR